MITLEDFKKLEIRIAKIKDVQDHPNADKLFVITIDLGDKTKQVVAGIRDSYKKEDLIGRNAIVVDNLEPAMLRGVESQGMILATRDDKGVSIITPDRDVTAGSIVK